MENKKILITGATDGIGKQTALELANEGATVIIHGRSEKKAKDTIEEINSSTGNKELSYYVADFASLNEVKSMADKIVSEQSLDVLINNAGIYMNDRQLSEDGYEMTFAINHLAHFALTLKLLENIHPDTGRIINVASMAHASGLDFANLNGEKSFDSYDAYAHSKLCNILFTYALDRRLKNSDITVNCLHPGVIATKLLHAGFGVGGAPVHEGSKTSVYLATSNEVSRTSGKYFVNRKEKRSSQVSYDEEVQERLWELSEELTGVRFGE